MCGILTQGQDAGSHNGVDRLYPAVQHLWKSGHVGDLPNRDSGSPDGGRCTPGGDNLYSQLTKVSCKLDDACFIGYAEECSLDFRHGRWGNSDSPMSYSRAWFRNNGGKVDSGG